jgi:cytochrome P450
VSQDEPDHRNHRALVAQAFASASVDKLADDVMRPLADELIDRFVTDRHADLVAQFSFDFSAQVIAALLGLPRVDVGRFQSWTADLLAHLRAPDPAERALRELRAYVERRITTARAEPEDDLISRLVAADVDGERLSDDEIYTFIRFLLPAGVETTFRGIGNALFLLCTNDDGRETLRCDPSRVSDAVEEVLRFEVPMLVTNRVAAVDCELEGVALTAGTGVLAVVAAANRDDLRYADPDRFDIERHPLPHVSLGFGAHVCLGMHLARAEMRVAIERVIERLPGLRIDPHARDVHIDGIVFRSPPELPVVW